MTLRRGLLIAGGILLILLIAIVVGLFIIPDEGSLSNATESNRTGRAFEEVPVYVLVKSATTDGSLEGASVELTLDNLVLRNTTDSQGLAVFMVSVDFVGQQATIVVEIRGYAIVTVTMEISAGESGQHINIFPSPVLAESEYRIVLSWDTTTDLDIYALGKDRTTGRIECKVYWDTINKTGCPGVNLDIDHTDGYGPETITWTDANNDAYKYELYVHDYNETGVAGTGANVVLYGETEIKLNVEDVGSGLWWMLGTFEPSVGISSFNEITELQNSDPDTRPQTADSNQTATRQQTAMGRKPPAKKKKKGPE